MIATSSRLAVYYQLSPI